MTVHLPTATAGNRRYQLALMILVCLANVILFASRLHVGFLSEDDPSFGHFAERPLHGELPNIDFFDDDNAGLSYLDAGALRRRPASAELLDGLSKRFPNETLIDDTMDSASVLVESSSPPWQKTARPQLAAILRNTPPVFALTSEAVAPPTTDDWPYVYRRGHSIPTTYLTASVILLLIALRRVSVVVRFRDSSAWFFFLLGSWFLLVETQLVSRLALCLGLLRRTPQVNLVVAYAGLPISLLASCPHSLAQDSRVRSASGLHLVSRVLRPGLFCGTSVRGILPQL